MKNSLFFLSAAVTAVSLRGWSISPSAPDLRPSWKNVPLEEWHPNVSFLGDLDSSDPSFVLSDWIDPTRVKQLRQSYEDMRRDYELRQQYHLAGQDLEIGQVNQAKDFSNRLVDEMRRYQIDRNQAKLLRKIDLESKKKKLEQAFSSSGASHSPVKKVAMVIAGAAAIGTGSEVKADLGRDFLIYPSANLPYRVAYVKLSSPLADSTFTYAGDSPGAINPFLPGPPGWLKRDERYTLSLSRSIQIWSLTAGLTYFGTSETLSSALSKPLAPHLVATYESTFPMDPTRIGAPLTTQAVKLSYEKHF